MCTTSIECKIVITSMLTIKSGTDCHMISQDFGWIRIGLVLVRVGYSVILWCDRG
jgi:hypothetical protein